MKENMGVLAPPSVSIPNAWYPRSMAPLDRRVLVLCDDKAPYPVMIGQWDGERRTFVSHDKGTGSVKGGWGVLGWLHLPEPGPILVYPPTCSFCGKDSEGVKKLIAGPAVMICDECIELCREIVEEAPASVGRSGEADETPLGGSTEGESAVGEAETPNPSQPGHPR